MGLSWLGRGEEVSQEEVKELTKQFYVTLRATAARLVDAEMRFAI